MSQFKYRIQHLLVLGFILFIFIRSEYYLLIYYSATYFNKLFWLYGFSVILLVFVVVKLLIATETKPFFASLPNVVCLFILGFVVFRLPFLFENLKHEDSMIAEIFLGRCKIPDVWFLGRNNGQDISILLMHPTLCFDMIALVLKPIVSSIDFYQLSDLKASISMRVIFSLSALVSAILLLVFFLPTNIVLQKDNMILIAVVIICHYNSRLFVSTSVSNTHIDSTYGILSACLFAIMVSKYFESESNFLYLFLPSILFAFGKQEWSVIMLIACGGYLLVGKVYLIWKKQVAALFAKHIFYVVSGIITGNLISLCYDYKNYTGGLILLYKMTFAHIPFLQVNETGLFFKYFDTPVLMQNNFKPSFDSYLTIFSNKMELSYPIIVVLIFCTYFLFFRKNFYSLTHLFMYLCSVALFIPFFLSSWYLDRYFCPTYLFSLATLASILQKVALKKLEFTLIAFSSFIIIYLTANIVSINISAFKKNTAIFYAANNTIDKISNTNCMNIVDVTINKPRNVNIFIKSYAITPRSIFFDRKNYKLCEESEQLFLDNPN